MAQWTAPNRPERGYFTPREKVKLSRGRTAVKPKVKERDLSSHTDPLAKKALRKLGRS